MPFKIMIILLHFRQARMNKFHQFSILTTLVQYREKIRTCRRYIFFSYLYVKNQQTDDWKKNFCMYKKIYAEFLNNSG